MIQENPFADEEAEEDDGDGDEDLIDGESDENTELPGTMKLRLDSSDDEEHTQGRIITIILPNSSV